MCAGLVAGVVPLRSLFASGVRGAELDVGLCEVVTYAGIKVSVCPRRGGRLFARVGDVRVDDSAERLATSCIVEIDLVLCQTRELAPSGSNIKRT